MLQGIKERQFSRSENCYVYLQEIDIILPGANVCPLLLDVLPFISLFNVLLTCYLDRVDLVLTL